MRRARRPAQDRGPAAPGALQPSGAVGDEALAASAVSLQRAETRVAAERLRRIGELDARKAFLGRATSTADWLAPKLGLSRGQAKGRGRTPPGRSSVCPAGEVCEVVVDDRGRPLKVSENGRPTLRQRRAVIARDRSCIGCGAPASRCQVHHVVWQRHRGATVVGNLVLVCYACHHAIHHDGWTVTQQPPGRYRIRRTPNNPARTGRLRHTT
ncbi:MAG TPA: HNH endonuclease signature motif containing protein [Egibacteraceae bacterium]|nr:HNH endonuclease signature motif containing protein [Egibacteraceae bacterium]